MKELGEIMNRVACLLLTVVTLWSCGKEPTKDNSIPPDAHLGDVRAETEICPAGGLFHFGPVSVEVPAAAVANCVALTVQEWPAAAKGHLGLAFKITLADGSLLKPVTLTIRMDEEKVVAPQTYGDLKLVSESAEKWQVLPESEADTGSQSVSGSVESLGVFAIVPRVKIDVLFAVESGAGMCHLRRALGADGADWLRSLAATLPNADIQAAAITDYMGNSDSASFTTEPASSTSPGCPEYRHMPCLVGADCEVALGPGWVCKSYSLDNLSNLNGSINSYCVYRCEGDSSKCCGEFCGDQCEKDPYCPSAICSTVPSGCPYECMTLGQSESSSLCMAPVLTAGCPSPSPAIVRLSAVDSIDSLDTLQCIVQAEPSLSWISVHESVFRVVLSALEHNGPDGVEEASFLRSDALLLVLFFSNDEDTSVDPRFASPNYYCQEDHDCASGLGTCEVDSYYSAFKGKETKLCHGIIKKDYFHSSPMLQEYMGEEHHQCAYDTDCEMCTTDEDCPYGWSCSFGKRCKPHIYSLSNLASYQSPPGTPAFSLLPVESFRASLEALKAAPDQLLIGAVVGDGLVQKDDAASLISLACLEDEKLTRCIAYSDAKGVASADCLASPSEAGCEPLYEAKLDCIRECYLASYGNGQSSSAVAKNTAICNGQYGVARASLRYARLVESLGPRGALTSFCHPEGVQYGLDKISDIVTARVLGE
jgi:hypothetical protein